MSVLPMRWTSRVEKRCGDDHVLQVFGQLCFMSARIGLRLANRFRVAFHWFFFIRSNCDLNFSQGSSSSMRGVNQT